MSGEVLEEAFVVGTLSILKALELDLARLLFFGFIDKLAVFGSIERVKRVGDEKLKSPDDVGGVLNVAAFLEALEGNGVCVVGAIERADDEKGSIGVALKLLELAHRIINTELGGIA